MSIGKELIFHLISTYKGGGTSAFNPRMLLKDWILRFVNKIYSSRMLAKDIIEFRKILNQMVFVKNAKV